LTEREEGYMQQHLCSCMIDLNNEKFTTIFRSEFDPVSWPEIRVLQEVHGEQAVYDIKPVALGPRETPLREKERLMLKYGRDIVEAVYAGKSFNMEFFMPGWPIDPKSRPNSGSKSDRPKRVQFIQPEAEDTRI
jgi:hypothetical protein